MGQISSVTLIWNGNATEKIQRPLAHWTLFYNQLLVPPTALRNCVNRLINIREMFQIRVASGLVGMEILIERV